MVETFIIISRIIEEAKDFSTNAAERNEICDFIPKPSISTNEANENEIYQHLSAEEVSDCKIRISTEQIPAEAGQMIRPKNYRKDKLQFSQHEKSTKVRRKKGEVEGKFFCELCNTGFTRKFDMQRHQKTKHPDIAIVDPYHQPKNSEILNKCKIVENGKTLFECDICKLRTNQSYNLMRHRTIHTGVRAYVCHICGNNFRLDSSLRKHIKQFHEGVKNFKCDICEKEFGAKSARDEHMNTHSDIRPFKCDICQKSFRQKSSLYVHKLYHTKNFKFECSLCEKKFRRAQELHLHNRLHTGLKPYACDECGVSFRLNHVLKKHRKIHLKSNEEWVCQDCQSTFSQERYLKLHRKIHIENTIM